MADGDGRVLEPERWEVVGGGADEELPQDAVEALVALAIESLRQRGELPGAPGNIASDISGMFEFSVEEAVTPSAGRTAQ
jgi:hypothetical protein